MISLHLRRLTRDDVTLMEAMSAMFGEAFGDMATYTGHRPSSGYLRRLLGSASSLAACTASGALAAMRRA